MKPEMLVTRAIYQPALTRMENVVLAPHIGTSTHEIRDERMRKLLADLGAFFSGRPLLHPVTCT